MLCALLASVCALARVSRSALLAPPPPPPPPAEQSLTDLIVVGAHHKHVGAGYGDPVQHLLPLPILPPFPSLPSLC